MSVVLKDFGDDIEATLKKEKPEVIGIGIDRMSKDALLARNKWKKTRLTKELLMGKTLGIIFSQLLYIHSLDEMRKDSNYSSSIRAAARYARENNVPVVYLDRSIDLTIKRTWYNAKGKEKYAFVRFVRRRLLGFGMKHRNEGNQDPLDHITDEVCSFAPSAKKVLIEERIEYISRKIAAHSANRKMVAIVDSRNRENIQKKLEKGLSGHDAALAKLDEIKKRPYAKYVKFVIPAVFISLILFWFSKMEVAQIKEAVLLWAIVVMVLCGLGATLARGHPYSILTAILLAPIFSWALIGSGWIAGIVELKVRSPQISDVQRLGRMKSYSEIFKNKCTRPLMVGGFANIGNLVAISYMLPIIARMGSG
jgi:pheromone shutdown-related protein TraB